MLRRLTECLARALRRFADRIDRDGAPKAIGLSFTFEPGRGVVVHGQAGIHRIGQPGCPLYYLNDQDYLRAHAEQVDQHAWIDPSTGQWMGVAKP
jgi:hypothetical protein